MTLAELIAKLEDIRCQNADDVIVVIETGLLGCHEIKHVTVDDAIKTSTGEKTIAVIIGD